MLTPAQLVHRAHGSPELEDCCDAEGRCYVCAGIITRGRDVASWLSTNFTDQTRVNAPLATHVCEACCFVMSRTSPVLGRPPGDCKVCNGTGSVVNIPPKGKGRAAEIGDPCPKCDGDGGASFGGNFRNYSHLYSDDWDGAPFGQSGPVSRYANASKGEKPLIRAFLQREHSGFWFASIADSGQKHVLPFAPLSYGPRGMVIFEESLVTLPDSLALVDDIADMLTGGVTKDEIQRGEYRVMTMREMMAEVRAFEAEHRDTRGSEWFSLAVWLAQRDEEQHAERRAKKDARNKAGRDGARPAQRIPARAKRPTANELLGADPKPVPIVSTPVCERERVGRDDAAQAPNRRPVQLGIPGLT